MSGGFGRLPYAAKGADGPAGQTGRAGVQGQQGPTGPPGADEVAGNYVASVTKYQQSASGYQNWYLRFTSLDGSQKNVQYCKTVSGNGTFVTFI